MKNILKRGAAVMCAAMMICGVFSACGGKESEELPAETQAASEGETTTSTFGGEKKAKSTPSASAAANANKNTGNNKIPSSTEQAELDDALSFAQSGMIDDAREMLGYIDRDSLSDEQKEQYDEIQAMLSVRESSESEFTADAAIKLVEEKYGIELNGATDGLRAETAADGRMFYRMQIEVPSENAKKTIEVYENGEITELSQEPLAFG